MTRSAAMPFVCWQPWTLGPDGDGWCEGDAHHCQLYDAHPGPHRCGCGATTTNRDRRRLEDR